MRRTTARKTMTDRLSCSLTSKHRTLDGQPASRFSWEMLIGTSIAAAVLILSAIPADFFSKQVDNLGATAVCGGRTAELLVLAYGLQEALRRGTVIPLLEGRDDQL